MKLELDFYQGIALHIASTNSHGNSYPTARIQKGWLLYSEGQDLSEEAVGFGVPVVKYGLQTIFPGAMELIPDPASPTTRFTARFQLYLEERIGKPGSAAVNSPVLYSGKNVLAEMIRRFPGIRGMLTGVSSLLRSSLGWQTTYEPSDFSTNLALTYSVDPQAGRLSVELANPGVLSNKVSEIVIMSEQGAHYFDLFEDSTGIRKQGELIGCWDEVTATQAAFVSTKHRLSFSLPQVAGAKLFAGRELIGNRLAWSGFGYTFPPSLPHFGFDLTIHRLT